MAKRRAIPSALRKAIIEAADGKCAKCGKPSDRLEVDHILPVYLGGTNDRVNLRALGKECCHDPKSRRETKEAAKMKRIRAKRLGTRPKRWKRKLTGRAVYE